MNIAIIKDSRQYEFITSQQFKTTIQLTIKYDHTREGVFFIPVEDKLTSLDVQDSRGRQLPQLSPKELEDKFAITQDEISSKDKITHDESFVRIPILLFPSDSEIEILTVTFVSTIDPKKYFVTKYSPNMKMVFRFRITPSEFAINSGKHIIEKHPYSLDMVFKVGDDYKIKDHTKIHIDPAGTSKVIEPEKELPNMLRFHVEDMDFTSNATGKITVGISESTSNVAWAISVAGIIIPPFLVLTQIAAWKLFQPTLEILGGVLAVLIGSRIWIVQDKYIMKKWADLHHAILVINASMFVLWFTLWLSGRIPVG